MSRATSCTMNQGGKLCSLFWLTVLFVAISLSGCQRLALWTYGIREYRQYEMNDYAKFIRGYDHWEIKQIDTTKFLELFNSKVLNDKIDHYPFQPLQVKIFDSTGHPIFWVVNCQVGGYPNLRWDRLGTFDCFPILPLHINVSDSIKAIDKGDYIIGEENDLTFDYRVDVYVSIMMGRQSKRLIKMVDQAIDKHSSGLKVDQNFIASDILMEL